jgi:hypothetical protein
VDQTNGAGQTAGATSADDLLSQLGGDEIDRLLAEAENEDPRPPAAAPQEAIAPEPLPEMSKGESEALSAELDALVQESAASPSESASAEVPAPVAARIEDASDESLSADTEVDQATSSAAKESEKAIPAVPESSDLNTDALAIAPDELAKPPESAATENSPVVEQNDSAVNGANAAALAGSSSAPAADPAVTSSSDAPKVVADSQVSSGPSKIAPPAKVETESVLNPAAAGSVDEDGPLPLHLRILDVIVWPLEYLPDGFLDAMGKVGVVTMINAIAVILYVVIIRHHGKRAIPPAAQAPHVSAGSDHSSERSASDARNQKHGS